MNNVQVVTPHQVLPGDILHDDCNDGCCRLTWLVVFVAKKRTPKDDEFVFVIIDESGGLQVRGNVYEHKSFLRLTP